MTTPDWIQRVMNANDGGWFVPLKLSDAHPLVADAWACMHCSKPFLGHQVALVMPFHGATSKWVATHRPCVMESMGMEPIEDVPPTPPGAPSDWEDCRSRPYNDEFIARTYTRGSSFVFQLYQQLTPNSTIPEDIMDAVFPPPEGVQGPDGFGEIEPHHRMQNRYDPNDHQAHEEGYYVVEHPEHGRFLFMILGLGIADRVVWADISYDRFVELVEGTPPLMTLVTDDNTDDILANALGEAFGELTPACVGPRLKKAPGHVGHGCGWPGCEHCDP